MERLSAGLNLRRGWKQYAAALKEAETRALPKNLEATLKYGAGLFFLVRHTLHYIALRIAFACSACSSRLWADWFKVASLIPAGMAQRLAAMLGFHGDRERGLEYLSFAYNSDTLRKWFAGSIALYFRCRF
jgi:hypothetical protein